MRYRTPVIVTALLALLLAASPAAAQNREHQQLFAEIRILQEQVQRLQLALNTALSQVGETNTRLDAATADTRKGFADQKVLIDALATSLRTLTEREGEGAVRVAQLTQEMKAIRDGLSMQQKMLNDILNLLQPAVMAATEPGAAGAAGAGAGGGEGAAAPPRPTSIPPSPASYYNAAWGYYASNQFDLAIEACQEALKRFPDSPEAPRAQMTIGESYFYMGQHSKEALEAFTVVITKYKDSDQVPEAYYKQGLTYEQLGQKESARKSYEQVRTTYPDSTAAIFATQALRRLGYIKDKHSQE
jgi:tol-pal system protein YbgF